MSINVDFDLVNNGIHFILLNYFKSWCKTRGEKNVNNRIFMLLLNSNREKWWEKLSFNNWLQCILPSFCMHYVQYVKYTPECDLESRLDGKDRYSAGKQ